MKARIGEPFLFRRNRKLRNIWITEILHLVLRHGKHIQQGTWQGELTGE